jgi:hypothetical protein
MDRAAITGNEQARSFDHREKQTQIFHQRQDARIRDNSLDIASNGLFA